MPRETPEYQRYCPDEEQIRISDAICLGRRRANFQKCPGCQFNDDEKGARAHASRVSHAAGQPSLPLLERGEAHMIEKVFKAYDVRATVPDPLDEDVAWRIGNATAQFLRSALSGYDRSDAGKNTLLVGRDMRKSSPALCAAFIEGAQALGTQVVDIGLIDTSQIYFATNYMPCCGGVQTTASHNPANYNGFKICGPKGKPVGAETGLKEIERIAKAIARHTVTGAPPVRHQDLTREYRACLHKYLAEPRPLKIVVDASNGMAGRWFPILFGDVPNLTLVPLNFKHDGEFVHPPNPLIPENLAQLRAAVLHEQADFGACFDGDADRCMFVDHEAAIVRPDLLTALLASAYLQQRPGAAVVYDLRSSRIVPEHIRRLGGVPKRERVGHVFMKRTMAENDAVFGGELSGHYYFRDFFYCDSGMMAFVAVVNVLTHSGKPLSDLLRPLAVYASSGERNFEVSDKVATLKRLTEKYRDAKIDHLDGITVQYTDWWFNARLSNTEPLLRLNMEAANESLLQQKLAELTPLLGRPADHG